jgi:hypothetical protein
VRVNFRGRRTWSFRVDARGHAHADDVTIYAFPAIINSRFLCDTNDLNYRRAESIEGFARTFQAKPRWLVNSRAPDGVSVACAEPQVSRGEATLTVVRLQHDLITCERRA